MNAPVAVVGGGPVGMACALALAARDVPVTVLERGRREVPVQWRGSTVHPRTLELLDTLDVAGTMLAHGVRVERLQYRDPDIGIVAELDYRLLVGCTSFPVRLQYEQYRLLELLRYLAEHHPLVDTRYEHEVEGLEIDGKGVRLRLRCGPGRTSALTARFAVAADGAHSAVRRALGIEFAGRTYPERSLVIATDLPFEDMIEDLGPVSYWTSRAGKLSFIRTPDHWRVALNLDAGAEARLGQGDAGAVGLSILAAAFGRDLDISSLPQAPLRQAPLRQAPLRQAEVYRIHQRMATTFRSGPVLLAGDAAHVNSPTGGMGLNSGVHDAFEMADALAAVVAGSAPEDELEIVAARRRDVAAEVVQVASHENTASLASRDPAERRERLERLARMAADEQAARSHLLRASMLAPRRTEPLGTAAGTEPTSNANPAAPAERTA